MNFRENFNDKKKKKKYSEILQIREKTKKKKIFEIKKKKLTKNLLK